MESGGPLVFLKIEHFPELKFQESTDYLFDSFRIKP